MFYMMTRDVLAYIIFLLISHSTVGSTYEPNTKIHSQFQLQPSVCCLLVPPNSFFPPKNHKFVHGRWTVQILKQFVEKQASNSFFPKIQPSKLIFLFPFLSYSNSNYTSTTHVFKYRRSFLPRITRPNPPITCDQAA